jgi:hypothetical protein
METFNGSIFSTSSEYCGMVAKSSITVFVALVPMRGSMV